MPDDLALIKSVIQDAGDIAKSYWKGDLQVWTKPGGAGPVTEADLAVDAHVKDALLAARPDYGWLSEETEDTHKRLHHEHVFIVDPIDGTRSFMAGERTWAVSIALANQGVITAAAIYLPIHDKLFTAALGQGAELNANPIGASGQTAMAGATLLSARPNMEPRNWKSGAPPPLDRHFRSSLAYRMALVAQGRFDAMLTLRATWEWDVAAGHLIATEAGANVSDQRGQKALFNSPKAQIDGMLAAPPQLHESILSQLATTARGA